MFNSFLGREASPLSVPKGHPIRQQQLPFPFMSGLINGHNYTKPGKKVFFIQNSDNKEVLDHQLHQINYNKLKKKTEHENERWHDDVLLKSIKISMDKEELKKKQFKDKFKTQYKQYNDNQMIEQLKLKKVNNESKSLEKYNFFPFTHGDEIEKKRIQQKKENTNELRDKYTSENSPIGSNGYSSLNRSYTNGFAVRSSHNQTGSHDFMAMRSFNGKVPVKFVTGYPAFLTPSKHHPYRRLDDTHVENTMQSAVKRYEESLLLKEKERNEDAQRFKQNLEDNQHYLEELELKKKKAQTEQKRILLEQMKNQSYKRLKENLRLKEKVNTNFGPEENEQTLEDNKNHQSKNVGNIK